MCYIHTCIHTYNTYIHTHTRLQLGCWRSSHICYIHACMHTYIHTYTQLPAAGLLEELTHVLEHVIKSLTWSKSSFASDQVAYICIHIHESAYIYMNLCACAMLYLCTNSSNKSVNPKSAFPLYFQPLYLHWRMHEKAVCV
jgi:hypothetical protein